MTASIRVSGRADHGASHLTVAESNELAAELTRQLQTVGDQLAEFGSVLHELTAASAESLAERDRLEVHAARTSEAHDAIQEAIARMEDGTYGVCVGCGASIPVERLRALATASFCVGCPPQHGLRR